MNFNDFEQLCKNNRILEFTTNKFYYRYDESTRNPNRYDEMPLSRDTTFYIINADMFNDLYMSNNEKVNMLTCIRSMGLLRSTGFDRRYSPKLPLQDMKGFEPNASPYPITFVEKDINTYFINKRYNNENNTIVYPTDTDICGLKNISYRYINDDNTAKTLYANCIIINKEYFWYNLARLLSSNVNVRYVRFYLLSFVQYLKTKNPDIYINTDKSVKNIEIFKDILEYLGKDKNDWILNNNNLRLVDLKM